MQEPRTGDLSDLLVAIAGAVLDATDLPYVSIGLVSEGGAHMDRAIGMHRDGEPLRRTVQQAVGRGVVGEVVATGNSILVDDVRCWEGYVELNAGMRSELCVPLRSGETVIGVMNCESPEVGRFDRADQALLEALATPVALAIRTSGYYRKEQRRLAQLTLLNEIGRAITSTVEIEELLPRVVDCIRERLGYAVVCIGIVDDAQQEAELRAASSEMSITIPIGHRQRLGVGVVGEALRRRCSLLIPDVRGWPNYVAVHPDIRSEICCPLWVGKRIVGFLDVEATKPNAFDEADQMLVETVAEHISQAVRNAHNLKRMQQQREDLAAMLVHDLRSPLTVIQLGTELLAQVSKKSGQGSHSNHGRAILIACDRMRALIDGMLELQRLESGEVTVTPDPTDTAELVREVCLGMDLVAKRGSIELAFDPPETPPQVIADPALLTRVLENLINNALRVTPAAGRVTLAIAEAPASLLKDKLPGAVGGAVLLTVEDGGPGVPTEHRERIFDKFATLEARQEGNKHSTGLGLAFCREAVQVQAGAIWVESATGPGARFCVLLPAVG